MIFFLSEFHSSAFLLLIVLCYINTLKNKLVKACVFFPTESFYHDFPVVYKKTQRYQVNNTSVMNAVINYNTILCAHTVGWKPMSMFSKEPTNHITALLALQQQELILIKHQYFHEA